MNGEPAGEPAESQPISKEGEEDDWSVPKRESQKKNLTVCSVHSCRYSVLFLFLPSSPVRLSHSISRILLALPL